MTAGQPTPARHADPYRAAVEAIKALLPDSPPFGHVRVVDIWDALHDVTEHECSAGGADVGDESPAPEPAAHQRGCARSQGPGWSCNCNSPGTVNGIVGDAPCSVCGRDNRNATHDALERRLGHPYTPPN